MAVIEVTTIMHYLFIDITLIYLYQVNTFKHEFFVDPGMNVCSRVKPLACRRHILHQIYFTDRSKRVTGKILEKCYP